MKRATAFLVAWLCADVGRLVHARLALDWRDPGAKQYPVSRVVTLLRDMQKELEKEADSDEEVFQKMDCWCKTNDRDKTSSIQSAEARVAELTTVIETSSANSGRLSTEIKSHEQDLTRSQQSLDQATAMREQELAEFNSEEKDMVQSIQALDSALVVLGKHQRGGTAFLDSGVFSSVLDVARVQLQTHQRLLRGALTPKQRRLVLSLQQADPYTGQTPTFRQAYQPQSSEIFGILRQMKESFETNLAESRKEEADKVKAYQGLRAAKEDEIRATKATIDQKKIQLAETDEKNAKAKQDIEDTRQSFSTDDTFLITLKEKCATTRQEYDARKKMRNDEISAVAEAISILSSDESRDTFSRTFNPALVQRRQTVRLHRATSHHAKSNKAVSDLLSRIAARAHDPRLAALAVSARDDPLAKVKDAITALVSELTAEKQAEIQKKDSCTEQSHQNELATERYRREKADLTSKAEGLRSTISELASAVQVLSSEIAEMQLQIKRKGEDRELENRDFQSTLADQRETQKLLQKALAVLKRVYSQKEVPAGSSPTSLAQSATGQEPAAPQGFVGEYGEGRTAGGVLGLMEQIIRDAEAMEKDIINEEQSGQKDYETFVQETNAAIQTKQQGIVHKNAAKAQAEQELITVEDDSRAATTELETLLSTAEAIKLDCDFIVKNFDIRQEARDQEIEALEQAKAMLSGMKLD